MSYDQRVVDVPSGSTFRHNYASCFGPNLAPPSDRRVETADLSELLKNPHVKTLYNNWINASNQLVDTMKIQRELFQENIRLTAENEKLIMTPLIGSRSRSPSISPSDSISHVHTPPETPLSLTPPATSVLPPAPGSRPAHYPPEILWYFDDCKHDKDVATSPTNRSRPSMYKAVRHENGTCISSAEWSAIKSSARLVKNELLLIRPLRDSRGKACKKTKTYYRKHHPQAWTAALEKLEFQQPLLALCASHWKAEHILGNALIAHRDSFREDEDDSAGVSTTGKKRTTTLDSPGRKKKKIRNSEQNQGSAVDMLQASGTEESIGTGEEQESSG